MRTQFEQYAHDVQKKKLVGRSSFDHSIETYTGGEKKETTTLWDMVLLTVVGLTLLFGIMLITN